jgi:hypothetical protein
MIVNTSSLLRGSGCHFVPFAGVGNSKRMPTDSARSGHTKLSVWILAPVDSISLHEIAKKPQCLLRNTACHFGDKIFVWRNFESTK